MDQDVKYKKKYINTAAFCNKRTILMLKAKLRVNVFPRITRIRIYRGWPHLGASYTFIELAAT